METMTQNVLLLEDDHIESKKIQDSLGEFGLIVTASRSFDEVVKNFDHSDYSLVLIDTLDEPAKALDMTRWIRQKSTVPIIMFVDRMKHMNESMCLKAGADDYVSKPINHQVLTLRVNQQLGRVNGKNLFESQLLSHGELTLDLETCDFWVGQTLVPLTKTEFYLMRYFLSKPERVFTRPQLLAAMNIRDGIGSDHLIDTHLSRLRVKIRNNNGQNYFYAVRGLGVKLSGTR